MRKVLLVYPKFPPTFWGLQYAVRLLGKKAVMPPLGLLTIAGMLPSGYDLKVLDMNVTELTDDDLSRADLVLTSTMIAQQESLREVIERSNRAGRPIVAGGPYPTSYYEGIEGVDHFVLGEVEDIFSEFITDLERGTARKVYRELTKPSVSRTPLPRFDLIDLQDYNAMTLQFSRGCPFDCEFCDITKLYGRVPRTKTNEQVIAEFDLLYTLGWRGLLFLVDDNFIGNKREAMRLLPAIASWQKERRYPFLLTAETTVNLASADDLLDAMVDAGFVETFVGVETPNQATLLKTKKMHNTSRHIDNYLLTAIRKIQSKGLQVTAGFILGLDGDDEYAFDAQIQFIEQAGIPAAMVGLLSPLSGTDLYKRLQQEGRLLDESIGNNVSLALSFTTEIDRQVLIEGYKRVLRTLYDPDLRNYFDRCLSMIGHVKPNRKISTKVNVSQLLTLGQTAIRLFCSNHRVACFRFFLTVLRLHPQKLPVAIFYAAVGYHLEKITSQIIKVDAFDRYLDRELEMFKEAVSQPAEANQQKFAKRKNAIRVLVERVEAKYGEIDEIFQYAVKARLESFKEFVNHY